MDIETTTQGTEGTEGQDIELRGEPVDPEISERYGALLADLDKPAEGDGTSTETSEAAPATDPATKPKVEETEKKPEEKKPDDKLELQLVRAQRDVKRLTTEALTQKQEREKTAGELEKLRAAIRKDFIQAAIDETGLPVDMLFKKAQDGSLQRDPLADLPPDIRATIEWARDQNAKEAETKQTEAQKAQRKADLDGVTRYLTEHADKYHFLDASPEGAEWFLDEAYAHMKATGQKPDQVDLEELATRCEDMSAKGLKSLLTEKSVRMLVSDPLVRELFVRVLALPNQQKPDPTSSKGPVSVPKPLNQPEVLSRSDPDDQADTDELVKKLQVFRESSRIA